MPIEHKVEQGECISSIAEIYGFFPETIWELADNSELKDLRQDPNVLMAGDTVIIPDKRVKEEVVQTGQQHRFKRKGVPEKLIIQFKDENEPRANKAYDLIIDEKYSEGKTDDNGTVDIWIPPNAREGRIIFKEAGDEYKLELGYLDPITEVSGVQARLQNLGYYYGLVDGKINDAFKSAICDFQKINELDPTGELDSKTRNKIQEIFKE